MKTFNAFLGTVSALCLIVLLLAAAVQTPSLGLWFYKYEFKKNDSYNTIKIAEYDLNYVAVRVISFLDGSDPILDDIRVTVDGRERLFFNEQEISHMDDVAVLFEYGLLIRNIAAIGFFVPLAYFLFLELFTKKKTLRLALGLWRGFAIGVLAAFGGLGILIAANFSRAFNIFHEIFFTDNWLFNPKTSLMINMLPNQFFQDIAIFIGAMYVMSLLLVIVLSTWFRKLINRSRIKKEQLPET